MNALVSIVIPYYKKKKYIKRALGSIYNQTYKNFEIIIIYDDADLSDLLFLKNITKKKFKTKLIINKKNLGAGLSRNIGVKEAKGEYIAFLDADDFWHKNKLKFQMQFMIKKKYNISFTSYSILNEKGILIKKIQAKKKIVYQDLLKSCDIGLSTVILRKKLINKNIKFPNLKTKEDYVLWLKLSKTNNIFGLQKALTIWRQSSNSLSSSILQKLLDAYKVYRIYLKFTFIKCLISVLILSFNFLKKRYL